MPGGNRKTAAQSALVSSRGNRKTGTCAKSHGYLILFAHCQHLTENWDRFCGGEQSSPAGNRAKEYTAPTVGRTAHGAKRKVGKSTVYFVQPASSLTFQIWDSTAALHQLRTPQRYGIQNQQGFKPR